MTNGTVHYSGGRAPSVQLGALEERLASNEVGTIAAAAKAAWYIDPVDGDDAAAGDVATPLKTIREWASRVGQQPISVALMTVHLVDSGDWPEDDGLRVRLNIPLGNVVRIVGTSETLFSGTLTGAVAIDHATNVAGTVTNSSLGANGFGTGVAGSRVGYKRRFRITGGNGDARTGAIAWGVKDPATAKTIRTSAWSITDSYEVVTPASGDTYVIERMTTLPEIVLDVFGNGDVNAASSLELIDIAMPENFSGSSTLINATIRAESGAQVVFKNCAPWHMSCSGGLVAFYNCHIDFSSVFAGFASLYVGTGSGLINVYPGAFVILDLDYIRSYGASDYDGQGRLAQVYAGGFLFIGTAAVFDSNAEGLLIDVGGTVLMESLWAGVHALYGSGNATYGVRVKPGGKLVYDATLPTVTGTTAATIVGGTQKAYNALPFFNSTNGAMIAVNT